MYRIVALLLAIYGAPCWAVSPQEIDPPAIATDTTKVEVLGALSAEDATAFFEKHQFCFMEIRSTAKEAAPNKPFGDKPLLSVAADSEHLQLRLNGTLAEFTVSHRLRKASGPVIELSSENSSLVARLTQKKPLLGCVAAPTRQCRMSSGTLELWDVTKSPNIQVSAASVQIKDWCGGAKKESLVWAPLSLEGLIASQWD